MEARKAKHGWIWTTLFSVISVAWVFPIFLVVLNSFKKKVYISKKPFALPTGKMFVGLENYVNGINKTGLISAFGWSVFITVFSVAAIILFCSMTAWYITRVKSKVTNHLLSVSVLNDRAVSDGNVYTFQDCKYVKAWKSGRYHCSIPWIWCGAFCIYVYRLL